jgi:DNA-binding GntR family transcriptional regulator
MSKSREFNLSSVIYKKLRELITYGQLSPGEKIIESRIAKDLNTSRIPIREAIKQLEGRGYVETIHNKGTYVRKISWDEVEKIYDILSILEGYSTGLALRKMKNQDIEELEKLNSTLKELNNLNKYKEYIEVNLEFHSLFPKICGNDFLLNLVKETRDRVHRYRFLGITIPGHIQEYILDHETIIEAIKEGDPIKAEKAMKQHVQRVRNILVDSLRNFTP